MQNVWRPTRKQRYFCTVGLHGKPVATKIYASLATRSAVKEHAIERVGQTTRYWDTKMADAIIAAWWGAMNP